MGQIIYSDGRIEAITPKNGRKFTLAEMQGVVDGFIEVVPTHDNRMMVIDEEGKLKRKPMNMTATLLYQYGGHDEIVGDVLLCSPTEIE